MVLMQQAGESVVAPGFMSIIVVLKLICRCGVLPGDASFISLGKLLSLATCELSLIVL